MYILLSAYFLAEKGQSCDNACNAKDLQCNLPSLEAAAKDGLTCKGIIESILSITIQEGVTYHNLLDYSGCSYYYNNGHSYRLLKSGGIELPTCKGTPRNDLRRVCSCLGSGKK